MTRTPLTGKSVAITGGAQGIGRATAAAFLRAGASVVVGDLDREQVERAAAELALDTGRKAVGVRVDVADPDAFDRFLGSAETALGGLDVVVNNAGIMPTGSFLAESDAVTDRQLAVNLGGVLTGTKLAGRRFAARGGGHIVNVASVLGLAGAPGVATYCATKFAVVGLGEALHQELAADAITVTTICPPFVNTQLISGLVPNWLSRQLAYVEPDDVARAIVTAVQRRRGGRLVVPAAGALSLRLLAAWPEGARNRALRLMGSHDTMGAADAAARTAYLDRVLPSPARDSADLENLA